MLYLNFVKVRAERDAVLPKDLTVVRAASLSGPTPIHSRYHLRDSPLIPRGPITI